MSGSVLVLLSSGSWCSFCSFYSNLTPISFPLTAAGLRFDTAALGLAQVASSFVLDILVLCFPIPVISKLQLKNKPEGGYGLDLLARD